MIGSLVVSAVFGLGLVAVGALADRGTTTDGGDDAGDTANAVVGTGITPFTNRAPLSVPRSEHSQRHG